MPLKKVVFKPGVNRENSRYTSEGGWFESDKIRFRQGMPEKIGGWAAVSNASYLGTARNLHAWVTLTGANLVSIGTNLKYYIEQNGVYFDITPIRATVSLTNPFTTSNGSATVTVTDANAGYKDGDYVTFSNATAVGGLTLNGEFAMTYTTGNTYTITATSTANASATGGGTVSAAYQINTGNVVETTFQGWGAGQWNEGATTWGNGGVITFDLRMWSHGNFGEDLIFGFRDGGLFFWDASVSNALETRAVALTGTEIPSIQKFILVSDNRFVFCFGANPIGSSTQDPMLVRWSDQEDATNWNPLATNQAGSLRLSKGSEIIAALVVNQEILVWTDSALYSLQYIGAPAVWSVQLIGENISIISQRAMATAGAKTFWMGQDKFYIYDGTAKTLPCSVKSHVFTNLNTSNLQQLHAGTNEGFDEIWWFYPAGTSLTTDSYVIYNYVQDIWYYGSTLERTAWLDSGIRNKPIATAGNNKLVTHEDGNDNFENSEGVAITASITSAQFDLDDGHNFMLISRIVPDVTFEGSTADSPVVTMSLLPLQNSGSGYNSPISEGGSGSGTVTRAASSPVETFTEQIFTRVRGRQASFKIESSSTGVKWQLGAPRLDMRPDGRR